MIFNYITYTCSLIENCHIKFSFDLKPIDKNGEIYAELHNAKLELDPEHVSFHFDNLFNGDKALGDNMNEFMNNNWKDIFTELSQSITKALGLVTQSMMNTFFSKFKYSDYFINQ